MTVNKTGLGRLEKVDLRSAWSSESSDFTPWLADQENLEILGKAIGLELELEAREKYVGPFRADILCKDTGSGNWVLVENQLEQTDHSHLGQLLTYAAGLQAVTIVWVAAKFTEEHRATLDWLNAVTEESITFFGLEIELWRIGNSAMAPKFNVVSKPNDWSRTVSEGARRLEAASYSEAQQIQLEFWTEFKRFLQEHQSTIHIGTPPPQNWMDFSIGRSNFSLQAFINIREKRIGIALALFGPNAKPHYYMLEKEKAAIENELGTPLEWAANPSKVMSYIYLHERTMNPLVREQWPQQHTWLWTKLEAFKKVFALRVRRLDASNYRSEEPAEQSLTEILRADIDS
ncbi:MAG TPA: DUF4268 domain-containing protein [Ktedonobacteraceae bacterium]|nr:DUF4268 domain-containing protein [Ktedonobacteraceae bacterium]